MLQASYKTGSILQNGSSIQVDVQGLASLAIDLAGTFVGTVIFEYTINGTDWRTLTVNIKDSSTTATGATAAGAWTANVAGLQSVRVRCTAYTSGTITVALRGVLSGGGSGSGGGGDTQTAGADAASNTANAQTVNSRMSGFNGTTWDRIRTAVTTISSTFTGFLNTIPWGIYHATPTVRSDGQGGPIETDANGNTKVTQATYVSGEDSTNNSLQIRNRTGWSVVHSPAANTAATASKSAGAAGVKHVCRGIIVSCSAGASAPTAIQLTWNLRDGATGAGTILASGVIGITAVAGASPAPVQLSNLWHEGTAATAMTLEFTAAGGANTSEAVTLIGEDIF